MGRRCPGESGNLPRLPVPRGDPWCAGVAVTPPGGLGPQGDRDLGAGDPGRPDGVDEAPRHGPCLRQPLSERGFLRWGEETKRDPPDGHVGAGGRHLGRDRLGPRRRRAADRRPRDRPRDALPPDPRGAGAGQGSRDAGRAHRRKRRTRARRTPRPRGLRGVEKMTSALDTSSLDIVSLRKEFPLLEQQSHGHRIVYLDSAASSQRPRAVLDAMDHYYETTHANVHRGVYAIAEEATRQFEAARTAAGRFIGAPKPETEIVFAKNATEALNL